MNLHKDIVYAENPERKLDIYLPEKADDAPVLIWFHGGGLTGNTKEIWEVAHFGKRFPHDGFIVIAPDYRKSPQVEYPAYVEDAAAALAWTFKHINDYGGAPDKIFVGGHSAGAYLAAMISMAPKFLAEHKIDHKKIKAIIPVSGQMDTHNCVRGERKIKETGFYEDNAAPWHYIQADLPPVLVMAAENDMPGRSDKNRSFVETLKKTGHKNVEFIEIPDREHVSIIEDILEPKAPVAVNLLRFTKNCLS